MAEDLGSASLELEADQSKLKRDLAAAKSTTAKSGQSIGKEFKAGLDKAAIGSAVVLGAVAIGAKKAIGAASDLAEAQSAVNTVFGKSAGEIQEWSRNTDDAFSQVQFLSAAKTFAGFGQAADLAGGDLNKFSGDLIKAAGDLASFHNVPIEQALDDMRSGLSGETEPLRKYNILMSEAALQQEAARIGIAKVGDELTEKEKVIARQSFILNNLGAANNDYARTAEGVANTERRNTANREDATASIGEGLLPAYSALLGVIGATTTLMSEHTTVTKIVVLVIAALATGILILAGALKVYALLTNAATVATVKWTIALLANPVGLVIIALIALGVALVVLWKRSETFRAIVLGVWAGIKTGVVAVLNFLTKTVPAAFQRILSWLRGHWPEIAVIISGPFAPLVALATDGFGVRSALIGALTSLLGKAKTLASNIGSGIKNGITGALSGLGSLLSGIIRGAINAVIGVIRGFGISFPGIDPPGPGSIPGFSVHPFAGIPYLDRGGIIPGPIGVHRLAMVAGGETVLPTHRGPAGRGGTVAILEGDREFVSWFRSVMGNYGLANGGAEPF